MNKSIYGMTYIGQLPACAPPPTDLTVERLTQYLERATSIIVGLVQDGDKSRALGRLNIIRQEIALLTNTPYVPLVATTTISSTM